MPLWHPKRSAPTIAGCVVQLPTPVPRTPPTFLGPVASLSRPSPKMPYSIRVVVSRPTTGERLNISMEIGPRTCVHSLKMEVASLWRVPPSFQQLSLGPVRLDAACPLAALLPADGLVRTVTMSLVLEEVFGALEDSDVCVRCRAVEAVAVIAFSKRGDEQSISALIEACKDEDGEVRRAAAEGLAALAEERSDERALEALSEAIRDHYVSVRLIALRSLVRCALRGYGGDEGHMSIPGERDSVNGAATAAMSAVVACLADDDFVVRAVASEAIASVAKLYGSGLVTMLAELLVHRDAWQRHVAAEALEQLARSPQSGKSGEAQKLLVSV
eukprot:TRINITY_DN68567_c0_g1_i1.p1 TRINITY_DN68567_c0_g1~~TRINITY_DN68567_c0_g1_i1.p1  ORF type:complete len:330 (+),score=54.40 TRINITY_DN68567_c0_g1_i1:128-1117(+)